MEDSALAELCALIIEVQQELVELPLFKSVQDWTKDLCLKDFMFMDAYTYLVESKDKEFDYN